MANLLQRLLESLGIWKSESQSKTQEIKKFEDLKKKQEQKIRDAHDDLAKYKEEIAFQEKVILEKEKEKNASHGETRKIVEREIEMCLEKIDLSKGKRDIVFRSIESGNVIVGKLEELILGLRSPEQDVDIDDLLTEISMLASEMKDQDRQLHELRNTGYESRHREEMDITARLAELHGEMDAVQNTDAQSVAEKSSVVQSERVTDPVSAEEDQ